MLAYRKTGVASEKSRLLEKQRMIRDHFMCEDILKRNNFDNMFILIETAKNKEGQLWIDLEFYRRVDYIKRQIKRGTYKAVAERFSVGNETVTKAFYRCIRIELKKYSAECEGVFAGYHGNLSTEEDILNEYHNIYQ